MYGRQLQHLLHFGLQTRVRGGQDFQKGLVIAIYLGRQLRLENCDFRHHFQHIIGIKFRFPDNLPSGGAEGTYVFFDIWYSGASECRVQVVTPGGRRHHPRSMPP